MKKRKIPTRYLLVSGTFLLSLLLYIDRASISAGKNSIAADLNLTDKQMGWILSAFALGYALTQTPAGILADKFGPRRTLTAIVALWSAFTALTGMAWSYFSMLIIRFFFGVSEAGAFPGMSRAIFSWFPLKERGLVTGINFSGSRLGAAFALPIVAWLIESIGWRVSFTLLGAAGIGWALVWFFWFKDDPADHRSISEEEKVYILANRQQTGDDDPLHTLKLAAMLKSRNMWLAMFQYFCSNFTFFFTLTWLFPDLQQRYGLTIVEAGFYASAPLMAGAFGNWFSGWMVDAIYKRGRWKLSRRLPAMIGFALVVAGLLGNLQMDSPGTAILFLSLAIFGADMTISPSWSLCVDIGRKHAGAVSGTMNMAGNLGSFITALAFPYLLAWTGSNQSFFFVGAGLASSAIVAWGFMKPDKALDEY